MKAELHVVTANKSKVITPSGFKGYDACINPYVGCEMGCAFCYVRWMVRDPKHEWGKFIRLRTHIKDKLPKELERGVHIFPDGRTDTGEKKTLRVKNKDLRVVIGTMTDPYMPRERKVRITRTTIRAILAAKEPLNKVGIFTRSPIVLDDLDLIKQLPRKRVHTSVSPFPPDVMKLLEPIAIRTERRFDTIRALKKAGVRCHVNVAPAIPLISEGCIEEYAKILAEIGVDEFFVDPMQAYSDSWEAVTKCLAGHKDWPRIRAIMEDREAYAAWKEGFRVRWFEAWDRVRSLSPNTLPIWSDHIHKTWVDMRTGLQMDTDRYGDDTN